MKISLFWRRVFTVASGTAIAQLILLGILPILTRSIGKEVIGEYFYGISIATIFVVLANFRLDMAIFLEDKHNKVIEILRASFLIGVIVSFIVFFVSIFLRSINILENNFIFWLAVSSIIFSLGITSVLQSIYIQNLQYNKLSFTKIMQSLLISFSLLISIKIFPLGNALLIFHAVGMLLSLLLLFTLLPNFKEIKLLKFNFLEFKEVLVKYKKFPLISMPAALINNLAIQLPVIIIGFKFGVGAVAIYALMMRVMLAPISLMAGSILSVFKEKAAAEYRVSRQCSKSYIETFKSLFFLSIIPLVIGILFIKKIFILVFGIAWSDAGLLAQIMIPMFFLKFIASPLSYTFFISNGQKYDLIWQVSLLIFTFLTFFLSENLFSAVKVYSMVYGVHYIFYLAMSYMLSKPNKRISDIDLSSEK